MSDDGMPTWPSIAELEGAKGNVGAIPASLIALVSKRYEEHAPEYISDEMHHSGKPYNLCMFADSLKDCEEEVIDAVFNAMVYNMRAELGATWHHRPNLIFSLVEVWNLLQRIKEVEAQR